MSQPTDQRPQYCPWCGCQHRSWRPFARHLSPRAVWIAGNGRFASLSNCRPAATVALHANRAKAQEAVTLIDKIACGSRCTGRHEVIDLAERLAEREPWEL